MAGELQEVIASSDMTVGEIAKIESVFHNTGDIPVRAKTVAEVYKNGKLVSTFEGDEKEIGVKNVDKVPAFFRPMSAGNYKLSVSVNYESKSTDARNVFIHVVYSTTFFIILGVIGAVIIVAALILMKKSGKKKGSGKSRRK